ncbi:3-dehydroquinate synthase family protein [Terrilactibacillus sp. S3-3]|nr:3-dehydroquinate synthase family protein [Terrilactibacillus sp. S3-3]
MDTLMVRTQTGSYPVFVGKNLRNKAADLLNGGYSAYYIITDSRVAPLYLADLEQNLKEKPIYHFIVPAGEQSKNLALYEQIITDMLEKKQYDRGCCVIALGGGVVGDLAGFVAATFLRGVAFIQMPTTLLAHDSTSAGKWGLITPLEKKNLIGAFYPPKAVIYDTAALETLPLRELQSGFVELVKHSFIDSAAFYEQLKAAIPDQKALTAEAVSPFLLRGIGVKAAIVERDEHESGLRTHLNLGHTLGHAIEKEAGFGALTHGEGVAIGILFAMQLSEAYYGVKLPVQEVREWFAKLGLPTGSSSRARAGSTCQANEVR